mmetsp:Transcript_38724/g.88687  ORF Transcript_38724/g.88687 Transcript_38724/m.88687 type:complete len:280 (+) Transcript_38724:430-1269(+)
MNDRTRGSSYPVVASSCERTCACKTTQTTQLHCRRQTRKMWLAFDDVEQHDPRMTGPLTLCQSQWSVGSRVLGPARLPVFPWLCRSALPQTQGTPRMLPALLPCPIAAPRNPSRHVPCKLAQTSPGSPPLQSAVRPQWRRWPPLQCGSTCMPGPLLGSTCAWDGRPRDRNRPSSDTAATPGEWPGARPALEAHAAASRGKTDGHRPSGQTFPSPFPLSTLLASVQRIPWPPVHSCCQCPTPPSAGFPAKLHGETVPMVQTTQLSEQRYSTPSPGPNTGA